MNRRVMRRATRTAGRDMGRVYGDRTGVVQNAHGADFHAKALLRRYCAGSGALAGFREAQTSGASRGTIHTQPTRPATLTSAAVTKDAVK